MKLKIIGFEKEVEFDSECVNILRIDNTNLYTNIIENINNSINDNKSNEVILLNEQEEILNMSEKMYILFDVFNIEYNSKKIINKVYELISKKIGLNEDFEIERLSLDIRKYLITEINEIPFEFIMKDELEVIDILKLFNLKIDESNYTTILERLEFLIDLLSTLKIAEILVIPNIKLYLEDEETVEFYKYALYNNIKLLIIEKNLHPNKLKYETIYHIDSQYQETKE